VSAPLGLDRPAIDALGWTLVHFAWQGLVIALGFAALDRSLSRASANVRYLVACGTLLTMLAVPIGTFVVLRGLPRPSAPSAVRSMAAPTAIAKSAATRLDALSRLITSGPDRMVVARAPRKPLKEVLTAWAENARLAAIFPWLVMAWGMGVLVLSIRLLGGWWLVRRMRDALANAPLPEWQPRLFALSRRIGVSRPVRLLRSAMVQVPTAIGWLHPVILLPTSTLTGLSPRQIESILAHELAHIRRHDYLVNLLQSLVETLLFYHPGVWWVSSRIREERELCCDDLAVGVAGDPAVYAEALFQIERLRGEAAALVVAASGGSLLARIRRLAGVAPRGHEQPSRGLAAMLGAGAVVALMLSPPAQNMSVGVGVAKASSEPAVAVVKPATVAVTIRPAVAAPSMAVAAPTAALAPGDDAEESSAVTPRTTRLPYTIDEWIDLSHRGVNPEMVSRFESAGLESIPANDLMALVDNGVRPEYAAKMRQGSRGQIGAKDLILLAQHGVTPEYVSGLGDLGAGDLSTEDLVRLADHGVTSEWYAAMRWMGYPGLTVDRAIHLRDQGLEPEFASQLKIVGGRRFTLDDLETMRTQGVSPEYVAGMENAVGAIRADALIRMYQQGVRPEYAAKMRLAAHFEVDELIDLYQQGVTPEFVFGMIAAGYAGLGTQDLIRLYQNGVDGEFVADLADAGYSKASVSEIIRMRQEGVPPGKKGKS